MSLFQDAEAAFRKGRHKKAAKLYQEAFREREPDLIALLLAAKSNLRIGQPETALRLYDQAILMAPSHATAFSRKTCYLLAKRFGEVSAPNTGRSQISMRSLGNKGRFGNQVLQYAFLKCYATKFDLDIGTMEWPGTYLFSVRDPRPNTSGNVIRQGNTDMLSALQDDSDPLRNRDVTGYFQFNTAFYSEFRSMLLQTFRPSEFINPIISKVLSRLRGSAKSLVVFHLRRGDFESVGLSVAQVENYLDWLTENWPLLDKPVLYIATDAPELVGEFEKYNPFSLNRLNPDCKGFEFAIDWFVMQSADVLACSNSTFSISAAITNANNGTFLRPSAGGGSLQQFDPESTPILLD